MTTFSSIAMKPNFMRTAIVGVLGAIFLFFLSATSVPHQIISTATAATTSRGARGIIPNNVHYVHLMKDANLNLQFNFEQFLSVYGTYLYFQPDAILLHTDASEAALAFGRSEDANIWTRLILTLPSLTINKVVAPTYASGSGRAIKRIEHKSDFVRMDAVYDHGGVYLDFDIHPLRDIKVLRESGFANVVGREQYGKVNNGFWMSKKRTGMVELFIREANRIFDGRWTTHSCKLLTELAERLTKVPGEVLIMDQLAFAPSSWRASDSRTLFEPHFETPTPLSRSVDTVSDVNGVFIEDPVEWWYQAEKLRETQEPWVRDYSSTYVVHAFDEGVGSVQNFTGITVPYVFARQSNFARLVYPAAKHAFDAGMFTLND